MASWMTYLHFVASILVLYWLYVGFQALVVRGKRQAFRLEQRRRAGIPDSDNRPFDVAQADALQKKRQRDLARGANAATPTATTTASSAKDYFGRGSPSLVKRASQRQLAASPFSPRRPNVVAPSTSSHLSPGQSSRYNPASYRAPAAASVGATTAPGYHRRTVHASQLDEPQEQKPVRVNEMEQRRTASDVATAAAAVVAQRGKKRGADEARDAGQEDSVIGGARRGKKGRSYQQTELGSAMDEDDEELEDEDEEYVPTDSETEMASVGAASGDVEDELVDDEDLDDYVPPSRTPANLLPRLRYDRSKAAQRSRRSRLVKKEPRDRSLADAMTRHSSDDGDDDVSMRTAQRPGSIARKQSPVSDSERAIGEEWLDPTSGFQHRMDLDTVLTDEEVSPGRKRRVQKQRRIKRRLTVKLEWRPKHVMPADSEHPDRGERVPHYVPVWLSEKEVEESRKKGELGEQAALQQQSALAKEAADRSIGSSTGSSPRNGGSGRQLDSLLYQPPHRIPLRSPLSKSRLSLGVAGSPLSSPARSRSATPDVSFGGAAGGSSRGSPATSSSRSSYTNGRGRLSLGTAGGSSSSLSNLAGASATNAAGAAASPLRNRALDAAGKRRREEELMKRIRQAREDKERLKKEEEEREKAKSASAPAPTPAFGGSSNEAQQQPSNEVKSSPFSFGAATSTPAPAAPKPAAPAPSSSSGGFTFGTPSTQQQQQSSQPAAPKAEESKPATSSPFNFNAPKPAAPSPAASSSTPFSFGNNQAKPAAPAAPAAAAAPAAPASGSSSTPFSFGPSKATAPAAPSSSANGTSTPFSFGANGGAANKPQAAPAASGSSSSTPFTFGPPKTNGAAPSAPTAGSSTPSFSFGAPQAATGAPPAANGGGFSFNFGKK